MSTTTVTSEASVSTVAVAPAVTTVTVVGQPETVIVEATRGPQGIQGVPGPPNELDIGTVTTGAPGSAADAVITGTPPNQILSLTIPRGDTGAVGATGPQGPQGDPGPAGGGTQQSVWLWNAAAVSAPLTTGRVGVDNDLPSSATHVWISKNSQLVGIDWSVTISALDAGDHLYLQAKADAASFHRYVLTGPPVANGTNWVLPVADDSGSPQGTEPADGAEVLCAFQFEATLPVSANPTATIGLAVVNGVAGTFMRSDAAPALSQAIAPTWSGAHTFTGAMSKSGAAGSARDFNFQTAGVSRWILRTDATAEAGSNAGSDFSLRARDDTGADLGAVFSVIRSTRVVTFALTPTVAGVAVITTSTGDARYAQLAAGNVFTVSPQRIQNAAGAAALRLTPLSSSQAQITFDATTGFVIQDLANSATRLLIDGTTGAVTMNGEVISGTRFRVGSSPVSSPGLSSISITGGNALEWGHSNSAGYRSTLGYNTSNGSPFVGLSAEAGTTANLYRTRGKIGWLVRNNLTGTPVFEIGHLANANADDQTLTVDMSINSGTGVVDFTTTPTVAGVPIGGGGGGTPGNPTAQVGLAVVNGAASTFMRSDAAPPLDQAIAPTWTAKHTHTIPFVPGTLSSMPILVSSTNPALFLNNTSAGADRKLWGFDVATTGAFNARLWPDAASGGGLTWLNITNTAGPALGSLTLSCGSIRLEPTDAAAGAIRAGAIEHTAGNVLLNVIRAAGQHNLITWGQDPSNGNCGMLGSNTDLKLWLAFNAEKGTNNNTFRTRGVKGYVIRSNLLGGLEFGRAPTATADNQALTVDMTISAAGVVNFASAPTVGGSAFGAPGGADTQVQYNNAGAFGASAELAWASATKTLTVGSTGAGVITSGANALTVGPNAGNAALTLQAFGGSNLLLKTSATTRLLIAANGEWQLAGAAGTNGQVLTSAGAGASPTWQAVSAAPAGSDKQVQFNNATAMGADADFTWDLTSNTLAVGSTTTAGNITGRDVSTSGNAGANLFIRAGSNITDGSGGSLDITGGQGFGANRAGGNVTIGGGSGQLSGGSVTISGGIPVDGTGGSITVSAANAVGTNRNGGVLTLQSGFATGSGTPGYVVVLTGATTPRVERLRILANGAWSVGSAGTNTGTAGQALVSNGAAAAPTWQAVSAAPAGADTQVQFNNAGAMGASADFTFNNATHTLYVSHAAGFIRAPFIRADTSLVNSDSTKSIAWNTSLSYGTCVANGLVGGYCGFTAGDGTLNPTLMSNAVAAGVYLQGESKWLLYRSTSTLAISSYSIEAVAFNVASRRALKRETGRPSRAADILSRLRPILYRLLAEPEREQLGLIAEEVQEVCPLLSDGKSVSYDRLALLLLADWQAARGIA